MTENGISRREFLKILGLGASSLALGAFGVNKFFENSNSKNNNNGVASASSHGSWSAGSDALNDPVIAGLLNNGKVFYLSGSGNYHPNKLGPWTYGMWDPATDLHTETVMDEDLFCAGNCTLSNGNILLAGGTLEYGVYSINGNIFGLKAAYEVDFNTGAVGNRTEMAHGRWYPTCVELADGKVFVLSGLDEFGCLNKLPEIYDPDSRTWSIKLDPYRTLPANTLQYTPGGLSSQGGCYKPGDVIPPGAGQITYGGPGAAVFTSMNLYPRAHLLPNGLVCIVGQRKNYYLWDPTTGALHILQEVPTRYYGTSILCPLENTVDEKGKVLVCCGGDGPTGAAFNDAEMAEPGPNFTLTRRSVAQMTNGRRHPSPVLLPTGKIVIVGGNTVLNDETTAVYFPEEFDPETETWTILPSMSIRRMYHSVALLLLDGKIWVAGTTIGQDYKELRTEIFSPWYVSEVRPTIVGDPTGGAYGGTITISTPDWADITKVSLVKQSSITHHYNTDQRLLWLQIVNRGPDSVTVLAPINPRLAPPGMYLVHVLNNAGVPSIGKFIQIPTASPADIIGPDVDITSPTDGATITGPPSGVPVNVSGTAADNAGGSGIQQVEVQLDAATPVMATPVAPGDWSSWSASLTATTAGSHTITAKATDNSTNTKDKTISITVVISAFTSIYKVTGNNNYLKLYTGNLKRAGEMITTTSVLKGKSVKKVSVVLKKSGNPTGTISVVVRKGPGDAVVLTFGTIAASSLTTTDQTFTLTAPASRTFAATDKVLVEWTGTGTSANQVWVKRFYPPGTGGFDGTNTKSSWYGNNNQYASHADSDLAGEWFKEN